MKFFGGYQPKCNKKMNVPYSGSKVNKNIEEVTVSGLKTNLVLVTNHNEILIKENEMLRAKIVRLIAEIERLKAARDAEFDTIHTLGDDYEKALEEISRLKAENNSLKDIIEKKQGLIIKLAGVPVNEYNLKIKTEAVNEFIKNFNLLLENLGDYHALCVYEIKDRLDIVKNEMVGDGNA